MTSCPLCEALNCSFFCNAHQRDYFKCNKCQLIFVDRNQLISKDEEFKRYSTHNNDSNDLNYRSFLSRLINPLLFRLDYHKNGLDFGSGPGPTLSIILGEHGLNVENYDPFFANNKTLLAKQYDFITSTEVFEHLRQPAEDIDVLMQCLKAAGFLAVMTQMYDQQKDFKEWHYPRDPTHINFFSKETMARIAGKFNLNHELLPNGVTIFQKSHN
jgi:hypothetical protein